MKKTKSNEGNGYLWVAIIALLFSITIAVTLGFHHGLIVLEALFFLLSCLSARAYYLISKIAKRCEGQKIKIERQWQGRKITILSIRGRTVNEGPFNIKTIEFSEGDPTAILILDRMGFMKCVIDLPFYLEDEKYYAHGFFTKNEETMRENILYGMLDAFAQMSLSRIKNNIVFTIE